MGCVYSLGMEVLHSEQNTVIHVLDETSSKAILSDLIANILNYDDASDDRCLFIYIFTIPN